MQVQRKYRQMLDSIQSKFRVISQAYAEVVSQLKNKKQIIRDLNTVIQVLQQKLEQADTKINELEVKLGKEINIKKMIITSHRKHQSLAESTFAKSNYKTGGNLNNKSLTDIHSNNTPIVNAFQLRNQSKELIHIDCNSLFDQNRTVINQFPLKSEIKQKVEDEIQTKIQIPLNTIQQNIIVKSQEKSAFNSTKISQKSTSSTKLQPIPQQLKEKLGQASNKAAMKQLTKIWQERDRQIIKMEQLFENINNRIKQYDQ